jgi:hypothetical protein
MLRPRCGLRQCQTEPATNGADVLSRHAQSRHAG